MRLADPPRWNRPEWRLPSNVRTPHAGARRRIPEPGDGVSELRDLHDALAWLERHWTGRIPPTRLHGRGVEPESALGSPELADAFRRYLEQRPGDVITEAVSETCYHPRLPRNERMSACPDCDGLGVKEAHRIRYRDPMWRAVSRLATQQARPGQAGWAQIVVALVLSAYRPAVAARLIGSQVVAGSVTWTRPDFYEPMFTLAIRKLHHAYAQAPIAMPKPTWVDKSDSQRAAEEAA